MGTRLAAFLLCTAMDNRCRVSYFSCTNTEGDTGFDVSLEEFHSKKLMNKLMQQIHEPVVLSSSALPEWCYTLTVYHALLFPFEIREVFFASTALGMSR